MTNGGQGVGLEPRKAEVETRAIGHRPGEAEAARVAALGQGGYPRAAGIIKVQHLGSLVEGFAGGIVHRFAQQLIAPDAVNLDQLGVAARDQQCHEGKGRRLVLEHGSEQVSFHMVNAEHRNAECAGHAVGGAGADHQRADQPGACRVGDGVQLGAFELCSREHLVDQRQQAPGMVARGEFRHHTAVVRVHRHLAMQRIGQQAAVGVVKGDAGLVAGGFDA